MENFKQILVPVDFSKQSEAAIRTAAEMSRLYQAALTLVHVLDPLDYAVAEYESEPDERRRGALDEIDKALEGAKRQAQMAGASSVQTRALEGGVAAAIVDLARREGSDLIVMGTHGRTGFKRALLGSVAETVVRRAECAVLTIRAGKAREDERPAGTSPAAS